MPLRSNSPALPPPSARACGRPPSQPGRQPLHRAPADSVGPRRRLPAALAALAHQQQVRPRDARSPARARLLTGLTSSPASCLLAAHTHRSDRLTLAGVLSLSLKHAPQRPPFTPHTTSVCGACTSPAAPRSAPRALRSLNGSLPDAAWATTRSLPSLQDLILMDNALRCGSHQPADMRRPATAPRRLGPRGCPRRPTSSSMRDGGRAAAAPAKLLLACCSLPAAARCPLPGATPPPGPTSRVRSAARRARQGSRGAAGSRLAGGPPMRVPCRCAKASAPLHCAALHWFTRTARAGLLLAFNNLTGSMPASWGTPGAFPALGEREARAPRPTARALQVAPAPAAPSSSPAARS
jgi:hypothetical protein